MAKHGKYTQLGYNPMVIQLGMMAARIETVFASIGYSPLRKLKLRKLPMPRNRPTYLLIPDLPDPPRRWVDVEQEQEDNMVALIGLTLWGDLCQMEMERDKSNE